MTMAPGPAPPQTPAPTTPLPGWLGPIVTVTTQVGVPTVVAGVLLWFVLFKMGGTLDVIQNSEEDRVRILAAMQDTLVAALDRQTAAFEKSIKENVETNKLLWTQMQRPYLPPMPGERTPRVGDEQR